MSERRIEPGDLGELAGLPPDDPRVRALESDPRARAQLRAYRDFVAPGDVPAGARVADAEARLGEALEREMGVPIGRPADDPAVSAATGAAGTRAEATRGGRPPGDAGAMLRRRFAPAWRTALAAAAVVVVVVGVWRVASPPRDGGEPVLRGPESRAPAGGLATSASTLAGGGVRLEWEASAEADRYSVVFLSPDLAERARVDDVEATHLDLAPGSLPPGLAPGEAVLWRVVALNGSDEIARSPVLPLTVWP